MTVSDACQTRISIRQFLDRPVPADLVREILELAHRGSPSGGNLQPWRVHALTGEPLAALKAGMAGRRPETPEYAVYPPDLWDPYRRTRFECGEDLYATIGIPREDKPARFAQLARNGLLFDAPVGLFFSIDRGMGPPQWGDVGMYMQTVMLLAVERGLDTCAQEYWANYPQTVGAALNLPPELMLFSGMALGYRDPQAPINALRTRREPFAAYATMTGF